MRSYFHLLILTCFTSVNGHSQNVQVDLVNLGNAAPPLRLGEWIKGSPVKEFRKGHVYVLEFWATWCKPCILAMPHLSDLARKYQGSVTVIGINIYENKTTTLKKIELFVDSMGTRMDYQVATEDSNLMVSGWIEGTGETDKGIPRTFVINSEGVLAWIGHPSDLDEVLSKVVNNTWNIKEALSKRTLNKYLEELDRKTNYELFKYRGEVLKPKDLGKPDSALLVINEIITREPKLKYAPLIASHTFASLLKINANKAYEYGKIAMITRTYDEPPYNFIIGNIEWYSSKINLPIKIYKLCAEAYQMKIDHTPFPEIVDMCRLYKKMGEWFWRAKEKSKAIDAIQKAIQMLKVRKEFSAADIDALKLQLQRYKKM